MSETSGWPKAILLLVALFGATPGYAGNLATLRSAVFKIQTVATEPSLTEPWKKLPPQRSSGTGFYIGGGRILTNAHVVANATFVTVLRDGGSQPVPAVVRVIAHDCDLAILEPLSAKVFDGATPMNFGSLPALRSPVSTIGYPLGGDQLSITEGIVSRLAYRRYVHHGSASHLMVQVDSAINPGNSGGPVVQGRLVVGVAFQTNTSAEGTGYIIPTPVIQRFVKASESLPYQGHPDDGLTTNEGTMANPSAAAYHGLDPETGVQVVHVAPWAPTAGYIQPGDILIASEDQTVGVDGKVVLAGERVDFRALFDLKLVGETANFTVVRQGQKLHIAVPIGPQRPHHVPDHVYAKHAKYFVYGGLVFSTLNRSLLRTWGEHWYKEAPLLLRFLDANARFETAFANVEDIIVLVKRLPDPVNAYATANLDGVVEAVDGQRIANLADLVHALEQGPGEFVEIQFFGSDEPLVLSRKAVHERNVALNKAYGVAPDRWLHGAEDDGAMR